ncbi:hypothetical protein QFC21_002094 [Naganishia friedmannii]|uniref:Uncharacterized protein n=1 Tax=Naganishia friedmannii TaxID=89922 RepID=A0ACC2W0M0_9TREE|nr:hypothetical protein QFC21_002094 [Naganishia friedmannii]
MAPRLAVASRSRFELLPQDETDHIESDEDAPTQSEPVTTKLEATSPTATPMHGTQSSTIEAKLEANPASRLEGAPILQDGSPEQLSTSTRTELESAKADESEIPSGADEEGCLGRSPPDAGSHSPAVSSKGVKFQDGLSPGEGNDGETTIPGLDKYIGARGQKGPSPVSRPKEDSKHRNLIERTTWTFIMIGGFIILLCMGHPYMILLVMLCQTLVYKEVTALFQLSNHGDTEDDINESSVKREKWNKTLNWYFFVVTNYFLYGESIIYYFKHVVFVDALFLPFARNHRFISFMLYVFGFMAFVANLQKQYLRQQFALFCWVHMTLLVIVVSSKLRKYSKQGSSLAEHL